MGRRDRPLRKEGEDPKDCNHCGMYQGGYCTNPMSRWYHMKMEPIEECPKCVFQKKPHGPYGNTGDQRVRS
jgi:hypothetical protein